MPKRTAKLALMPIPVETVAQHVYVIRKQRVMLDSALAALYEVPTFRLNEAVKRNPKRFPKDFMFQLTKAETNFLTSHFAMSKTEERRGGRRTRPYAFTELGVAMLSSILNSERAVQMNIVIMRAFVKLRELLATNKDLAYRVEQIERTQQEHASMIAVIADELNALKDLPLDQPKRRIGFAG